MIDIIHKFLGTRADSEYLKETGENNQRLHVAAAALLMEMACIDGSFSKKEQKAIQDLLRVEYDLDRETIEEILLQAEAELQNSNDLWQFTSVINENFSREEKKRIIEMVWEVIYMDGKLDKHEDYLVHKMSRLLNLQHSELIEAKLNVLYRNEQ
ncbi:MAG: TerB family tellurite resistance protein [Calditrichaeota bacterium]|nr:TerB family tellurite resistance protein [Calditrichota bacterium]